MRFNGLTLLGSALVLAACGGNEAEVADTAAAAIPAAAEAPVAGAVAAAPITGTIHEVKMLGDEKGYRFEPAEITVKPGDGIKWVMVSGGPHNVAFEAPTLGAAAPQIAANMPNTMGELMGPMLMNPDESYTVSFGNVAPGTYSYNCTPHLAMGMTGKVTVAP